MCRVESHDRRVETVVVPGKAGRTARGDRVERGGGGEGEFDPSKG